MRAYHDKEWGVALHDARALWETLMLEGFQAGLSWITILRKREQFRLAFAGFDPYRVAAFDAEDIQRLMQNPGIVRARAKIEATIAGARIYCAMAGQGEDFAEFCWSFTSGKVILDPEMASATQSPLSQTVARELKQRGFKFVGPTIAQAWLQAVGIINGHRLACFRRTQV